MRFSTILSAAAFVSAPAVALAQQAAPTNATNELEEVVITAEKRSTNLQDTPLAVVALEADTFARAGVSSVSQLDRIVPDAVSFQGAGHINVITLRGVQPGNWDPTTEPTTATYLDGAIISRATAIDGLFYDLQRVEVLKGPQGTLYGRNATGGAINFITHRPDLGILGGFGEVEYGNFNQQRIEGAINLPLGESWALRAAFRSSERDGFYEDTGFADDNKRSLRLSVFGQITEQFSLLATADRQTIHGPANSWVPAQPVGGYGSFTLTNIEEPWRNKARWNYANFAQYETTHWGTMLQADYDFGFATLTGQYSHRSLDDPHVAVFGINQLFPVTFGPGGTIASGRLGTLTELFGVPFTLFPDHVQQNSDSFELRLASNPGGNLDWIVGAFYFDEKLSDLASAGPFVNYYIDPQKTESKAIFGQATYSPTDALHLTAGVRYTQEDYSLVVDNTPPLTRPVGVAPFEQEASKTNWRANIAYDLSPDNMIYGQVSTGMKGGHISTTGAYAEPEDLLAYEIGSKNQFLDNRLQMNFEVFYYDYKIYQSFSSPDVCVQKATPTTCVDINNDGRIQENVDTRATSTTLAPGGAKQYGGAINGVWLVSNNDRLRADLSYSHAKYGSYDTNAAILAQFPDAQFLVPAGDLSDSEFGPGQGTQGSPWRANLGYTHSFLFSGAGSLDLTADVYYYGQSLDSIMRRNEPQEYHLAGRDAYTLFDLSAEYKPMDGRWYIRGYIHNVADDDSLATKNYIDLISGAPAFAAQSGYIDGSYVQPRTYGLVIGARF